MTAAAPELPGTNASPRLCLLLFDCDRYADRLLHLDQSDGVLTSCERARAARLSDGLAYRRWVCARIALRRALGTWTGVTFETRAFEVTAHGRPYLAAPAPNFSLSHTGPFALIAMCGVAAIGADIEQIAPRKISAERRQRLEAFAGQLCSSPLPDASDARFVQAWCRIEAVAKAEGCGVGRLLTRAGLMGPAGKAAAADAQSGVAGGAAATLLRALDLNLGGLAHGFAAAIAGPAQTLAAWQGAGVLRVFDGGPMLAIAEQDGGAA